MMILLVQLLAYFLGVGKSIMSAMLGRSHLLLQFHVIVQWAMANVIWITTIVIAYISNQTTQAGGREQAPKER